MKLTSFLLVGMAMVSAEFYSSRYDDFDVKPLVENDRILQSYTNCFLDKGPCTPDAKEFKKVIPEALETTCGKCSPKQKQLIKTVIKAVIERHPEAWEELVNKYDKDRKFRPSFDKFINEDD
ncbi:allergen Tha p 1-like [Bombyx mandarina]|nr:chemosensory protein 11 precursor [Bombyx mori]XP_012549410.1 chemosensory protein 11 isoform X2 [Bombyx mori]XP_012549418.1 chemosensory protein 11 isoform X2 [Bombyx mori]XP_028028255.1 allergen Tha p 1-like [Bombyx mandarina]ABH88204.1 chemosensory protein 11 [Bombyx mori]